MPYCCRCGVEMAPGVKTCPLCRTPLPSFTDQEPEPPAYPHGQGPSKVFFSGNQLRIRIFFLLSGILFLPTLVVAVIDLFTAGALTWSRLPMSVLAAGFVYLINGFLFWKSFWKFMGGLLVTTELLLMAINMTMEGRWTWSLSFGLPLLLFLCLCIFAVFMSIKLSGRLGYNLFGFLALAASGFCLGLDYGIQLIFFHSTSFSWSLIVCLALLPLGFFFFLMHYALGRNINLKQTFHF